MAIKKIRNIKCVIVSLDETLYDNSKKVVLTNKKIKNAIIDFIKSNHHFIIKSNYNLADVKYVYNEIGIVNFCRYSIVCNGSVIHDNQINRQVSHRYLTRSIVLKAQEMQKEFEAKNYPVLLIGYDGNDKIKFLKSPFLTQALFKKYLLNNHEFDSNNYSIVNALEENLPLAKLAWKIIDPIYLKTPGKNFSFSKINVDEIYSEVLGKYRDSIIKPSIYLGVNVNSVELNMARIDNGTPISDLIPILSCKIENFAIIGSNMSDLDFLGRVKNIIINKPCHPDIIKKADIVLEESFSNFLLKALSIIE